MGSKDDHLHIPTKQRAASLMTSKKSAEAMKADGQTAKTYGMHERVPMETAQSIIDGWPDAPKKTGMTVLEHYGAPHEATATKMFWYDTGPWSRMELTADEVLHNFPTPHTDYLSQYVRYQVPCDKGDALMRFDGSTLIDRTSGELGSRCDHEPYNTLTLNLAVEIIEGKRTVDEARKVYAETASAYVMGRDAPYAEGLMFTPSQNTGDPDESIIAESMWDQAMEKVKDAFGAGDPPGKDV
jgi:hypothetical protein